MAAKRLPMRKLREILRLKHERGLNHRAIARACGIGAGTVSSYLGRARQAGLNWPLPDDLDDAKSIEHMLAEGIRQVLRDTVRLASAA